MENVGVENGQAAGETAGDNGNAGKSSWHGCNKAQREPVPVNGQLLSCHDVIAATRLARASIYRLVAAGSFPKPVKVGSATRWRKADVEAWLTSLTADAA